MDDEIRKRLRWVHRYEELGNAGVVCLCRGISRPTLRKWWRRYQELGIDGLKDRAHSSLQGKTPFERLAELAEKALFWEEVAAKFDPSKERIQEQNY